jgi:hypothetical protein
MYTDHTFHGKPIETSRVDLYCDEILTPEQIEIEKHNQDMKLRSMAKRMPHRYWREVPNVK